MKMNHAKLKAGICRMGAICFFACLAGSCVAEPKTPNVLFICIDDLRPELGCYGVDYIQSPNIDRLASEGLLFTHHYVQAPTCGSSRYALLTGTYGPADNGALFTRAKEMEKSPGTVTPSLPAWFRKHGYTTISIGKVSHHPGGLAGKDWDDPERVEMPGSWDQSLMPSGPWKHPRGAMHGLANGEIRVKAGEMDVYQSFEGPDSAYPDGLITEEALRQLEVHSQKKKPFFMAVGIIRPHLPFGAPAKYMEPYREATLPPIPHPHKPEGKTTWHRSGEFMKYNRWGRNPNEDAEFALEVRRHYAACVSYADAQVGRLLDQLEKLELEDNTIVVLWGDHGWHLGEHAIWGKHSLFEESLRSPLIIKAATLPEAGKKVEHIVESVDIYPALCELARLPVPSELDGKSGHLISNTSDERAEMAISYHSRYLTLRQESHRLIVHADGFVELYDHRSPEKETVNIASSEPERVIEMAGILHEQVPEKFSKEDLEQVVRGIK
jgi:iduronate 2-sulfatase